ncbi:MAG: PEP/pyruvate-binding domain-containing protein [Candidatus Promineifilaceae bacterium]|nr:PEP/pyruvate-binding domain-containing protein [Candidatus Promineifilaceae bacterium]
MDHRQPDWIENPRKPLRSTTSTIDIYIKLAQYPVLCDPIRVRMREEIFKRGIISEEKFEEEVEALVVESQKREGLYDPFSEEPPNRLHKRRSRIRAMHTDFYFGYNLPPDLFEEIIQEVLAQQPTPSELQELAFNPEVAPWHMLFKQGRIYEQLPPPEREKVAHHLEEIKVVLIKGMISDQLPYIGVAKKVFSVDDLRKIYERRIGTGKIGGKAAGMSLAWRILQQQDPEIGADISHQVEIPDSYFLGTDVIYEFRRLNNLDHLMNQKYRPLDEIREHYPDIIEAHLAGQFPPSIVEALRELLRQVGASPLIVRSSSLLEDNFGSSFAGKYQSCFCPNQGTEEENLKELLDAIRQVFASTLNPDAILYRQRHGLIDYDERMAILIQRVRGQRYGRYYFPTIAGVGFSQNPFRWHAKIRREEGFLRIVCGIGTRAVDRISNDYARMLALSHPTLRPETTAGAIRRYSQHYIDVIDLEDNELKTLPVREVLTPDYPHLRHTASLHRGDFVQEILSLASLEDNSDLVVTFNALTRDRKFVRLMRTALMRLEKVYQTPVDIEFTVDIIPGYPEPDYRLHILQCRPLSQREEGGPVEIPEDLQAEQVLFTTYGLVPQGKVEEIRYLIFVDPTVYRQIGDVTTRLELARAIGRLNKILEDERFILIGPGRWGSANLDLGVRVGYADIYNTKALIEMAVPDGDGTPELSYGTHFFQDLVEDGIYSLPLHLDHPDSHFRWSFFEEAPNALASLAPDDAELAPYLKVIDLEATNGRRLSIIMEGTSDKAVGFLVEGQWADVRDQATISIF